MIDRQCSWSHSLTVWNLYPVDLSYEFFLPLIALNRLSSTGSTSVAAFSQVGTVTSRQRSCDLPRFALIMNASLHFINYCLLRYCEWHTLTCSMFHSPIYIHVPSSRLEYYPTSLVAMDLFTYLNTSRCYCVQAAQIYKSFSPDGLSYGTNCWDRTIWDWMKKGRIFFRMLNLIIKLRSCL